MSKRTVILLTGAHNVRIHEATETQTTIHFNAPPWKDKTCIHIVPGKWWIDHISKHLITLANYDEVIPETIKPKLLITSNETKEL